MGFSLQCGLKNVGADCMFALLRAGKNFHIEFVGATSIVKTIFQTAAQRRGKTELLALVHSVSTDEFLDFYGI
jgi:hypothetical protein